MANPKHSLSRKDVRPAAGANPEVPSWAKDDYVLSRWIKEERSRRRRFLADQVLEPNEPLPKYRHPTIGDRIFGPIRNALKPLDAATGGRIFYNWFKAKKYLALVVVPLWFTHYVTKYHILDKPDGAISERQPVYPKSASAGLDGGHH